MANEVKVEYNVDVSGRRVETRQYDTVVNGNRERVVETHVEKIPMELSERLTEKIAPVVVSRKKETYQEGKVINTQLEELDKSTMNMVPNQNVLTKDDLVNVIRELMGEAKVSPKVPVVAPKVTPPVVPAVVSAGSKIWEFVEMAAYVVLSGELAYCLYNLVLKNWL